MAIREGKWDCPSCGHVGNRGPVKYCGSCGSPRGEGVKFYLPDDAPEVTDAEALRRAHAGPDWVCKYCNAANPADNAFCSGCGASRDGTRRLPVIDHPNTPPPTPPAKVPSVPVKTCGLGCLIVLVVCVILMAIGAYVNAPKEKKLTIESFHWTRTIAVEEFGPVTERAWQGEVPSGARILGSSSEVHHVDHIRTGSETRSRTVHERVQTGTRRVKSGTRDLGNGYFEDTYRDEPIYEDRSHEESYEEPTYRDEPVYRKKIRYEIEKWMPSREVKAEGDDHWPTWPDPNLGKKEREGRRQETYEIIFRDEAGAPIAYTAPNEQVWKSFDRQQTYIARVDNSGNVLEIRTATSAPP